MIPGSGRNIFLNRLLPKVPSVLVEPFMIKCDSCAYALSPIDKFLKIDPCQTTFLNINRILGKVAWNFFYKHVRVNEMRTD